MAIIKNEIFNAEITGAANFFSKWVDVSQNGSCGLMIAHPTGPTTTYTIEVANERAEELNASSATPSLTAYTGISIPAKSAQETFQVDIVRMTCSALRVKLANASGTGTPVITVATKEG